MALAGRVFVGLSIYIFFGNSFGFHERFYCHDETTYMPFLEPLLEKFYMPSKKICLKKIFSKFSRKHARSCRPNWPRPIRAGLLAFCDQLAERSILLKLSGDVESNPRPNSATPSTGVSTRKGKEGKEKDESSLAMIL